MPVAVRPVVLRLNFIRFPDPALMLVVFIIDDSGLPSVCDVITETCQIKNNLKIHVCDKEHCNKYLLTKKTQ